MKSKKEDAQVEDKKTFVEKLANVGKATIEYAETTMVLLYIFNGVASFLILFGLVQSGTVFNKVAGSIALAFSLFALVAFINKGVKHQSTNKTRKK